jgi:hypothetical protein
MKTLYCWRCRTEVPMLDEEEFAIVHQLYARAVRSIKETIRKFDPATQEDFVRQQYLPVLETYRQITGQEHTTAPADLLHHRISKYGPPCLHCGKPLRTPRATHCVACGTDRSA